MVDMMILKRKIYDELLNWKGKKGRTALLIEGARRVGKSTIVKEFAKNEYRSSLFIDFVKPIPGTIDIFQNYRHDIGLLLSHLALLYGVRLMERESLIVFDEVQRYPPARELIKYFVEDGRYDYIETGSLISIKKNVRDIQIPSEESRIRMNPLDFEEFLWANGDEVSAPFIRDCFEKKMPLGHDLHKNMMEKYKTFMLVGGMPQSVVAYLSGHDLYAAEEMKRSILKLYSDDLRKAEEGADPRATVIFSKIPSILSARKKSFRPGQVKRNTRTDDYASSISWLEESYICNLCRSINDPSCALNLSLDVDSVKIYMGDTGLLITHSFDSGSITSSEIMDAFVKNKLSINEGMFFENAVAQALVSSNHALYYSEFYTENDDKHPHEVDFISSSGKKIVPIEVKSSISSKHRSLDLFMEKYGSRVDNVYVVHGKDLRVDGKITYIPIYMTICL